MFVAAILIVILSPKCPPKYVPKWWQNQVCQQVMTHSFKDSNGDGIGDFQGVKEKLDSLRKVRLLLCYKDCSIISQFII